MIKNKTLLTPPVHAGVLNGITRSVVLTLAPKVGLKAQESILARFDLFTADELFLTGTAAEIIPVVEMDGRLIGDGHVGADTLKLTLEFKKVTKREGIPYAL
jgi:branched-chain amino acid aminotransferase